MLSEHATTNKTKAMGKQVPIVVPDSLKGREDGQKGFVVLVLGMISNCGVYATRMR